MFCEGYVSKLITVKSKLHFVWGFYRFIILLLKKMTLKKILRHIKLQIW